MASTMLAPSRALLEAFSPARQRTACNCAKAAAQTQKRSLHQRRHVSTAFSERSEMGTDKEEKSRWSQTPPAMKAPYPTKARPLEWQPFQCNSDPEKLDDMYIKFLGSNGPNMLSEETKWLAVTHKSFDYGRRGFNERLAFLGKRIMELQTSLALLSSMDASKYLKQNGTDPHGREPFVHPATSNVEVLLGTANAYVMHHKQIARLAREYLIPKVIRWQPKDTANLSASGSDMVYTQAVFAIIGALAMEQGGAVANRITRERVIQPICLEKDIAIVAENLEIS